MSYRITLGFNANWAEFCVPRDGDLGEAVIKSVSYTAKVIALDAQWRERFLAEAALFASAEGADEHDVRLANPEDLKVVE